MLKLSQYFSNSSVWALRFVGGNSLVRRLVLALTFVGGISPTNSLSKIRELRCFLRVFCRTLRGGAAAECTIFRKYNSHFSLIFAIICNSCFRKSWWCSPWCAASTMCWRWSFGLSASVAQRIIFWRPNGLPQFLCRWTLFPPFLGSKLFWQPSCTHLYPE